MRKSVGYVGAARFPKVGSPSWVKAMREAAQASTFRVRLSDYEVNPYRRDGEAERLIVARATVESVQNWEQPALI